MEDIYVKFDPEVRATIERQAEMEDTTAAAVVEKMVSQHVYWDKFMKEVGFLSISKAFIRSVLQEMRDDQIRKIAVTTCKAAFKDAVIYLQGEFTVKGFLNAFETWTTGQRLPFKHKIEGNRHAFIVQHDLGRKWSVYMSTLLTGVLSELGHKMVEAKDGESWYSFSVDLTV